MAGQNIEDDTALGDSKKVLAIIGGYASKTCPNPMTLRKSIPSGSLQKVVVTLPRRTS